MGHKRLVISIILSFFITVFCHPIYSGGNLFSSLKATNYLFSFFFDSFCLLYDGDFCVILCSIKNYDV